MCLSLYLLMALYTAAGYPRGVGFYVSPYKKNINLYAIWAVRGPILEIFIKKFRADFLNSHDVKIPIQDTAPC
jgi:hypothetical protein